MARKILVVDDNEDIRTFVEISLKAKGYEIITACDGQEGWEVLQAQKPDLLIVDVNMPRMDGREVVRRVRADDALKGMPVIMLTGEDKDEDILTGISGGADQYITKPFKIEGLLAGIKMMFEEQ